MEPRSLSRVGDERVLTVRFEDFWETFRAQDFFVPFLESALNERVVVTKAWQAPVDICMRSLFMGSARSFSERAIRKVYRTLGWNEPKLQGPARLSIWYTGENRRPPVDGYDLTLSFDLDTYGGTNTYLPLLYVRSEAFGPDAETEGFGLLGLPAPIEALHLPRAMETASRPKFACMILSNQEPTRMRMARALSEVGQVDLFGPAVGKRLANKALVACDYRYMICFENAFAPGYVTEKPLDAWILGCVPLWAGLDSAQILNPNAVWNLLDFTSMEAMVDAVAQLEDRPELINEITESPLLRRPADLESAKEAVRTAWLRVAG
jgi:hypothetical protein